MTVFEWLNNSMVQLRDAGVDSPRRDCLVFIEDLLKKDRAWVLAHHEYQLESRQISKLEELLKRRINREPLAYIRGKAWFYGRFFKVSPDVMIPRPESEAFIDILKEIKPGRIIDVGTGSGCLAVTAKIELPQTEALATDKSKQALKIAQKNAQKHRVQIKFMQGSLLEPLKSSPEAIIANLPYVPEGLVTSPEITKEPALALFSGKEGLNHYRIFWSQIENLSQLPAYVLVESLKNQHKEMRRLAKHAGYKLAKTENLIQLFSKNS